MKKEAASMIKTQYIEYADDGHPLEGYCAYDDQFTGDRPVILVCHDWSGRTDFACRKADELAKLGYIGFAIDMYGKGKIGHTKEEKNALMTPLIQNRMKLQQRIMAALNTVKTLKHAKANAVGAIGFCFGGLCALDLARSGADVNGVVSFHGLLGAPGHELTQPIKSQVLALHGFDDSMVTPEQVIAFSREMTEAKVNWQIHMYGHTMHAFTNPEANDSVFGTVYEKNADTRSWIAMQNFFRELF